jgi:hypothetical protein
VTSNWKSPAATIEFDQLPIRVRGFVPPTPSKQSAKKKKRNAAPPSDWTLIFDCETQVDARQSLRFGGYQLRRAAELKESGLFYNPEALTLLEVEVLRRFAAERGVELRTRDEFVDKVFYGIAYDLRASIVGFNLPFDLSRLAIRHGPARGKTMRGGFTFQLSSDPWKSRVQLRHLNARVCTSSKTTDRPRSTPARHQDARPSGVFYRPQDRGGSAVQSFLRPRHPGGFFENQNAQTSRR